MNTDDATTFERHRGELIALAYRMLGDLRRSEDVVQDAWLRWSHRGVAVEAPRPYLAKTVTRLCLNELSSARQRREELRGDRLPTPVVLTEGPFADLERVEHVSMALLVALERLTPAERAALLLADVFDSSHAEIALLLDKSEAACRQLLKRARAHIAEERRGLYAVSRDEHRRLLSAFLAAARTGDVDAVAGLLSDDAVLTVDVGRAGAVFGRVKNLPGPLRDRRKVAAFVAAVTPQGSSGLVVEACELNGDPAVVIRRDGEPYATIGIAVSAGLIRQIFIQADPARLTYLPSRPRKG